LARRPTSLGSGQDGLLDGLRQGDRAEERLRIKVATPGLIDNPEQTVLFSSRIAKRNVNFPLLKRRRIARVADAHDQLSWLFCHVSLQSRCLILNSLRPIPAASYQCTSARWIMPSSNRTRAIPLRLRHRPRP